ncbi:MAG: hypothetical protein QXL27_07650 [Candidatus Bathyarchaeia archaeon]
MTGQIKKSVISVVLGVVLAIVLSTMLQTPLQTSVVEDGKGNTSKETTIEEGLPREVSSGDMEMSNKSTIQTFSETSTVEKKQTIFTTLAIALIVSLIVYVLAKILVK